MDLLDCQLDWTEKCLGIQIKHTWVSSRACPERIHEGRKTYPEWGRNIPQAEGLERTKRDKRESSNTSKLLSASWPPRCELLCPIHTPNSPTPSPAMRDPINLSSVLFFLVGLSQR